MAGTTTIESLERIRRILYSDILMDEQLNRLKDDISDIIDPLPKHADGTTD